MDENFDQMLHFFDEIDEIGEIHIRQLPKFYVRDVVDPYSFYTEEEFRIRYRISKNTVLNIILPELEELESIDSRGLPVPLRLQILIALRFYATGSFQMVNGNIHFLSQPTVCNIIKKISIALAQKLTKFVNFSTQGEELQKIKKDFEQLGAFRDAVGLPNIVGAIDCTHIKVTRPRQLNHSEMYRNRHGWFSVNTQMEVDPNMNILDVVAWWPGSSHDSRIFRNSRLHSRLTSGSLDGCLVGDGSYACTSIMLTPLRSPMTPEEIKYNKVQIRTRNVVEQAFGVLKKRFSCLQKGLAYKLVTSCNIILACAVLHNIAQRYESTDINFEDDDNLAPDCQNNTPRNTAEGLAFRRTLIQRLYS